MLKKGELEIHTWKTLRNTVKIKYPQLGTIIDELSPEDGYNLYKVEYPYGAIILDKGIFQIPNCNKQIVSLYHPSIPENIKIDLDYNHTIPVGLVLKNCFESYMITGKRVVPATLFRAGELLALWRVFDEGKSYQDGSFWTISSGARATCMLPKITDKNCYKQLKNKFGLDLSLPKDLQEHWQLFDNLIHSTTTINPWTAEVIFLSKKWFSHKEDKQWNGFYYFLLNTVWQASAFSRNKMMFDFIFSVIQEKRNLKPNPYLADTAVHLMAIGNGVTPAFTPALDDSAAPIKLLKNIFINDYRLKKYAPIIMHMHHFSPKENRPVYYSFQIPTTMIFSPKSNNALTTMSEMRELKYIIETLLEEILNGNLGVSRTPLFELANQIRFNFYHTEKDKTNQISSIENLSITDRSFSTILSEDPNFKFPEYSPFFRGCISISLKT